MKLEEYSGILMAYNGGWIVDAGTGHTLYELHMERKIVKQFLSFLQELPVTVILDDGRQFYVTDRYGYMVEYECWNNNMGCVEAVHLETCLEFDPVKILMSVKPDQLSAVQEEIRARLPELFTVVQTAPFYLEIIPREINKGDGLKQICRALQIDISETIAFGDSENDIPMLRAAGIGVAMGNAVRAVQETADDVTLSNNEDGIAYYLKRL